MTYLENEKKINLIKKEIRAEEVIHRSKISVLAKELLISTQIREECELGANADDATLGIKFLEITKIDKKRVTKEVLSCFDDAISDIRKGIDWLGEGYFGVKAYDHWSSQSHNATYGMGPAYGSVWFRIGIQRRELDGIKRNGMTEAVFLSLVRYLKFKKELLIKKGDER